jgi:uncharacterized protein (TIGR00725 family)
MQDMHAAIASGAITYILKTCEERYGMQVSVIGSGEPIDIRLHALATACGKLLARDGHVLVCGGKGGVMDATSEGAHAEGGIVLGILPSFSPEERNAHLTAYVCTGAGEARNAQVVASGSLIIAFPGAYGTLSELSFASKWGKPIIVVNKALFPYDVQALLQNKNVKYVECASELEQELRGYHGI